MVFNPTPEQASTIGAGLVFIAAALVGYWQYVYKPQRDQSGNTAQEDVTLADVAKESLTFLQQMLQESKNNEVALRATVDRLMTENGELNAEVADLQRQLVRLTELNQALTVEVARLNGMLHSVQNSKEHRDVHI